MYVQPLNIEYSYLDSVSFKLKTYCTLSKRKSNIENSYLDSVSFKLKTYHALIQIK
jgi:uncharacterized protein YjbK